ncbi:unknown similar to AMEV233 [Mythimna separata entomopoxvirus 'L']|uniref:Uncharacterized protein n=1 Tax=Mythimna separata entomopoxvirus 'L' TaxID=1293572 RepID=A0A916P1Q6_9POXV|nr:unknown similar to AMEV233 [Mythimna separata entomopoxvirus 'L']CCU56457.1 unknown similar to AMEV233 [Mythimna separata entomopoxvirus 'L']
MESLSKYYGQNKPIIVEECDVMKTDVIIPNKNSMINLETIIVNGHSFYKNKVVFEKQVEFNDEIIFNNGNTIKNIVTEINKLGPLIQSNVLGNNDINNPFVLFYSRNDLVSLTEQHLIVPPNISAEHCIFYLVVMFNDGMSYCKTKFYYKIGAKSPFEVLSKEYINCDENKASIKYNDGSLKIDFKYNKSVVNNIKIKVYYSDI